MMDNGKTAREEKLLQPSRTNGDVTHSGHGGQRSDLGKSLVAQQHAVFEDDLENVEAITELFFANRLIRAAFADECQSTTLRALAAVGDRILEDVMPHTVDAHGRSLDGALLGVAVHLLQQSAARAKGHVVGRPARRHDRVQYHAERELVDAVALDGADMRVEHFVAFGIHGVSEGFAENVENTHDRFGWRPAVGPNNEHAVTVEHLLPQMLAPQLLAGCEDIVAVARDRHGTGRVYVEHVGESVDFMLASPGGDGGVFGRRNRVSRALLVVDRGREREPWQRVRPLEVYEMRRAADRCRLHTAHAATAEVVELKVDERGVTALFERRQDRGAHVARARAHRARVPNVRQQRLEVLGDPGAVRIGVLDGHQHVVYGHRCSFGNGADTYRQPSAMHVQDVAPALLVEDRVRAEVHPQDALGRLDFLLGHDHAFEVLPDDGLQAEEGHRGRVAAAAFEEGEDLFRARRILPPVADLVAVGQKQNVVEGEETHDVTPW